MEDEKDSGYLVYFSLASLIGVSAFLLTQSEPYRCRMNSDYHQQSELERAITTTQPFEEERDKQNYELVKR